MKPATATSLTRVNQQNELVDHDEFLNFYDEFEEKLEELKGALGKTRHTKELAVSLKKKGAWKSLVGSFSGSNTKELAHMVESLGISLETTQVVLQLVMKAQHVKNQFLRRFHDALVKKITLLQGDTTTLDENQRSAAIFILDEIKQHVGDQIKQRALVEEHQRKLSSLDSFVARKDSVDSEQDEKIRLLESRALEIIKTDEEQQRLIEGLKSAHASKDELDRVQTQRIDVLTTTMSRVELEVERQKRSTQLLESQQGLLIEQVRAIEGRMQQAMTIRARVIRHAMAASAFVMAVCALAFAVL